jgi:hypothetical protein
MVWVSAWDVASSSVPIMGKLRRRILIWVEDVRLRTSPDAFEVQGTCILYTPHASATQNLYYIDIYSRVAPSSSLGDAVERGS